MSFKDQVERAAEDVKHAFKHAAEDVKDAANEAQHRSTADAEQTKRDLAGDELTPGEYAGSVVNQKVNEAEAGIDRAKRDVRDRTA